MCTTKLRKCKAVGLYNGFFLMHGMLYSGIQRLYSSGQ
nr:MAG TPA: hypothetical protein [Caudoviricetes sp.]